MKIEIEFFSQTREQIGEIAYKSDISDEEFFKQLLELISYSLKD